jgi:TP901 family phage tail tape measure protein
MAATLRQFGLGAGDAAHAADILTYAANSTFNTVDSLGESLKYAGPVAKSLGMSLEDTTAILGVLGNVGIQGSEAGTALRRLSVISAGAGDKLQELFGITNTDADGNLKPLVQILDEINTVTANMPVAERTKKMAEAFGLLGITSANVLSSSAGGVAALAAGMKDADGVAQKTAKAMDAGLGGAIRITLSAIEGTALAIGDSLAPSMQKLVEFVGNAATTMTSFIKTNGELVLSLASGLAQTIAFGGALLVVGKGLSMASAVFGTFLGLAGTVAKAFLGVAAAIGSVLVGTASAIINVVTYGAASVAAATASAAAWALANLALLGQAVFLGVIVEALFRGLGGYELLGDALVGVQQAGTNAMGVLAQVGEVGSQAISSIYDSINAGNLEGAMSVALAGLQNAFQLFSTNFMNTVDEWGSNLVNAFDYWISNIPFLRFAGPDKFKFSLFGDSTDKADTADTRADKRLEGLTERKEERNKTLKDRAAGFQAEVSKQKTTNILRTQGNEVIAGLDEAKTMSDVRALAEEFFALKDAGGISPEQEAKYRTTADAAIDRITPTGVSPAAAPSSEGMPSLDKEKERLRLEREQSEEALRQAMQSAKEKSVETSGTFSSNLSGMGFGSSLTEQIAEATKRTAAATEKMEKKLGDEGAIEP